jgi:alanine racemase
MIPSGGRIVMVRSRNHVVIDLSALGHNFKELKSVVSPGARIMGIVKSDAYGHGSIPVSRTLVKHGVDRLGVAHLHEALELRQHGIGLPVVILCGIRTREDAAAVIGNHFIPVLFDTDAAHILGDECARRGTRLRVQVKVDTGMGRLGFPQTELRSALQTIMANRSLIIEGLTSHFSSADETVRDFTELQIKNFRSAIDIGRQLGLDLPVNNLANSAGIVGYRNSHFDMVRPGILLYGGRPSPECVSPLRIKPVMHFKGEVLQVREMPAKTPISYGRTYYTQSHQKIAVISAGYGDGLPRSLSNKGKVLIGGIKANIVGRVCMNMTMVDITGLAEVRPGTEVVFLGSQGKESISGDDMATMAQMISYEIFCSLGHRTSREYTR